MSMGLKKAGLKIEKNNDVSYLLNLFMKTINLNPSLSKLGLNKDDCLILSKKVTGALDNDPGWNKNNKLSQFYLESL